MKTLTFSRTWLMTQLLEDKWATVLLYDIASSYILTFPNM